MSDGLTEKQLIFAREYALHGKGSQAARHAGYSDKGASVTASRLLKKVNVLEAIEKLKKAAKEGDNLVVIEATDQVERLVVDRNLLTQRANAVYEAAFKCRQYASCLSALRFMAEMHDILVTDANTVNNFTLNLLGKDDDRSARAKTINGEVSGQTSLPDRAASTL